MSMGILSKSDLDLAKTGGPGRLARLLILLVILSAGLLLAWRAPSLNLQLFKDNSNMIPLTGSLWILILPESGADQSGQVLLKIAEPGRPGASRTEAAPGMMYLSRSNDGLIRPGFFFDKLPQIESKSGPPMLAFRYQIDESEERRAIAVLQGLQVLKLLPAGAEDGFDDLGPRLLAEAAQGRRLRVSLELKPNWFFEAHYDVSELGLALDQFQKKHHQL